MPDFSGPIQPLELASWLWLIPLLPLLGALINALLGSGFVGSALSALRSGLADDEAPRRAPAPRRVASLSAVRRVTLGSLALSAVAAAVHAGLLFVRPPEGRFLLQHLWTLVRVGQVDAGFDLALDPLAAVLVLVVTTLGAAVTLHASSSPGAVAEGEEWRFFAWLGLFVTSMLLLVLADNLLLLAFGWEGVAVAGLGLVGFDLQKTDDVAAGVRAFLAQRAGDVGLLLGVALLFWGLGGGWTGAGDYQSDLNPRVAAVSVTARDAPLSPDDPAIRGAAATQGRGFLTVTGLPDALVYLDDSRTPLLDSAGLPLRTPFRRRELAGGAHSFRVAPDDHVRSVDRPAKAVTLVDSGVLPNYSIAHLAFGGDREVALTVVGPTLRFRELRDELVLSDARGAHPVRDALVARKLGGSVGLVTVACLLMFLGVAAKSAQVPLHRWLPGASSGPVAVAALIQGGGTVTAGVYLLARLSFVLSLSPVASAVVAIVGAATALLGALASASQYDLRRLLAYSTVSQVGLAFVALGVHAYWVAVFQLAAHAVVKTCLLLAAGALFAAMSSLEEAPAAARDLRNMGGLGAVLPRTARAYRLACLALTAAPVPLLAGFWSTTELAADTFAATAFPGALAKGLCGALVATAALTSFGVWRGYGLAFEGGARGGRSLKKVRDASPDVARLLSVLGVLSVLFGLVLGASARPVGGDRVAVLEEWLEPVFTTSVARFDELSLLGRWGLVGLGLAGAYAGWAFARRRYGDRRPADWAAREASLPGHGLGAGEP